MAVEGEKEMDENKTSEYLLVVMKNLNLIIILFISMLITYCLKGTVQEGSALSFLTSIHKIPVTPWKIPVIALGLYGSMLILMQIKSTGSGSLACKVGVEIAVSFGISYLLGFSYTGMMLLILADTMRYLPKAKWKFSAAAVICIFYMMADYDLISSGFRITSLETYLGYFEGDVCSALLGVKNVLNSLNTLLFLFYIVWLVRIQMSEKERILSLNAQLNTANEELQKANLRLEQYAEESVKMTETRERNRLAREIHDTLGHALTGIITGIEACETLMDVAPEATKVQLGAIADVARQGMTDVRRSVKALRPDALEKFNLEEALAQTMEEMRLATNAKIEYRCTTSLKGFNEDEEEIIYRIVQECITNSIRHGKADRITIEIDREYNMLNIRIKDNGIGCKKIEKGFGLHHMDERLRMLQGTLQYSGEDGFLVEAQIPIRWGTEEKKDD